MDGLAFLALGVTRRKPEIKVSVDKEKIGEDVKKGEKKVVEEVKEVVDKVKGKGGSDGTEFRMLNMWEHFDHLGFGIH